MEAKKFVYSFDEGDGKNKKLLGGKGANLCEMTQIGLPVPPGFVITTEACLSYLDDKKNGLRPELSKQVRAAMTALEKKTGKKFGDQKNPLLVSVRSGAAISMPGMMDTILNLGLNTETVEGFIALTKDERFVYDLYRRLIQLFGSVALGMKDDDFNQIFNAVKKKNKAEQDVDLDGKALKDACGRFLEIVKEKTGKSFSPGSLRTIGTCH